MVDNNCIIEGNVKFRDGKKWKSRWCVMRKLSPVADCLHLQLYGDSKDRYKQGQTKASLSLQHFLGVQSGFTLDKESNTIAIICQDVTVVLAFDTRERLIQWQVKISNNLGEDQEFLVLISSAPARAKLSSGPAQLHVRERRFCMTVGVPPRLVGTWEIGQLRRYGVVEGRFCFEGGSRCGRGEGLHVLVTDQAEDIVRALQLAAEGKLPLLGLHQSMAGTGSVSGRKRLLDSPRRLPSGMSLFEGISEQQQQQQQLSHSDGISATSSYWSSAESCRQLQQQQQQQQYHHLQQQQEPDAASLLSEHGPTDWRSCSLSRQHLHQQPLQHHASAAACLERCSSCISKLGAGSMSKSSTCATTITGPSAASPLGLLLQPRAFDRLSLSSYSSSNSHESDYSASPQPAPPRPQQALPPRPHKPSNQVSKKPPMPLPLEQPSATCICKKTTTPATTTRNGPAATGPATAGPYENYDVPKTILHQQPSEQLSPQADFNYDTPRKIKECLAAKAYPNYDTPHAPQAVVLQQCGCPAKLAPAPQAAKAPLGCPCQNVISWAGFVLPYCRRGAGIEPMGVTVQPVRLSGEGKMPVVNASGQLTIYSGPSAAETSQNPSRPGARDCWPVHPSLGPSESTANANYENIEPVIDTQPELKSANYANIDFSESLGNYENSKTLMTKLEERAQQNQQPAEEAIGSNEATEELEDAGVCHKCGHPREASCSDAGSNAGSNAQDYLIVDEDSESPKKAIPGYLAMQPAHNACSKQVLSRLCSEVKSSSNPALSGASPLELNRKRSESEYRVPGSAMLSSPYFRRRLLDASPHSNLEAGGSLGMLMRKRSYSAESAHYLDDDDDDDDDEEEVKNDEANIRKKSTNMDKRTPSRANNEAIVDSETETTNGSPEAASSLSPQPLNPLASIKIRRSSSVPSKAGHNRDSSSSNDSGVSTGSLSHRTAEFGDFEFPLTTANTLIKKQNVPLIYRKSPIPACYHSSLPRKSKSSDPLKEITFQFHKVKLPTKSSSAEADIPTCLPPKVSKEFSSPSEVSSVPYIDSRSTSSGTSDMSDYIETLSLSSHSSSDAPDNLRIGGRAVTTTLRPRSGKEYYKIDRSILVEQGRALGTSSNYANIAPCTKKEAPRHPVT